MHGKDAESKWPVLPSGEMGHLDPRCASSRLSLRQHPWLGGHLAEHAPWALHNHPGRLSQRACHRLPLLDKQRNTAFADICSLPQAFSTWYSVFPLGHHQKGIFCGEREAMNLNTAAQDIHWSITVDSFRGRKGPSLAVSPHCSNSCFKPVQ